MDGLPQPEPGDSEFVEVDPTGRYGRYNEILGKGASKIVYRAFDEYEGIEVAWNQVKLYDFLQSPEELERLYCEIHLLKTMKHPNIMKLYSSWVDTANRNINFVTEMFTSGTLKQYRQKHRKVNIRAVKHWCRQILRGLLYLHSQNPPVIHRDLKCDNIFINGNQGEVKIGDLGLAAILRKSHAAHCVGTPEFMAPEIYEEEYNELVDIYSFGMCVLEMVTFEYPYTECTHPAQIYKKVISGKKPDALYKVNDPQVRQFVEKCLVTAPHRLSARELLNDPFLQDDGCDPNLGPMLAYEGDMDCVDSLLRQPFLELDCEGRSYVNRNADGFASEVQNGWDYPRTEVESGIELFECNDSTDKLSEPSEDLDISIRGKRREDGGIFLRIRISENEGRIRNIYFPFDVEYDTALTVATEMVGELDLADHDVTKIAEMIDGEISLLVPDWKPGLGIEETPRRSVTSFSNSCTVNQVANSPHTMHCLGNGIASTHGRFEDITYEVNSPLPCECSVADNPALSCLSDGFHNKEMQDQSEKLDCSSHSSVDNHSIEEHETIDQVSPTENDKRLGVIDRQPSKGLYKFLTGPMEDILPLPHDFPDDYNHEYQQELRWIRTKYEMEMVGLRDQQLGFVTRPISGSGFGKPAKTKNGILSSLATKLKRKTYQQTFSKSCDKNSQNSLNKLRTVSVRYPKLP